MLVLEIGLSHQPPSIRHHLDVCPGLEGSYQPIKLQSLVQGTDIGDAIADQDAVRSPFGSILREVCIERLVVAHVELGFENERKIGLVGNDTDLQAVGDEKGRPDLSVSDAIDAAR